MTQSTLAENATESFLEEEVLTDKWLSKNVSHWYSNIVFNTLRTAPCEVGGASTIILISRGRKGGSEALRDLPWLPSSYE